MRRSRRSDGRTVRTVRPTTPVPTVLTVLTLPTPPTPAVPAAAGRAGELAERCRYRIPIGERIVPPRFIEESDPLARLRALAYEGALRRYGTIAPITRHPPEP